MSEWERTIQEYNQWANRFIDKTEAEKKAIVQREGQEYNQMVERNVAKAEAERKAGYERENRDLIRILARNRARVEDAVRRNIDATARVEAEVTREMREYNRWIERHTVMTPEERAREAEARSLAEGRRVAKMIADEEARQRRESESIH